MKKIVGFILFAGFFAGIYATDARVIAMGRNDNFFMDEVSILRNPANINIYPNMVYGSFGSYHVFKGDSASNTIRDPIDPFFGGIVTFPMNCSLEKHAQFSMFSIGAFFDRRDELLDYITPGSGTYVGNSKDVMTDPAGKLDLLMGYTFKSGGMIGIGSYCAFQNYSTDSIIDSETSLYKFNAGINWPIANAANLEVSASAGLMRAKGDSASTGKPFIVANSDKFYQADARIFSALSSIRGDLVPHISFQRLNFYDGAVALNNAAAGLGINVTIDKGFFWAGLEGLFNQNTYFQDSTKTSAGGRVSFGIERSIWWNWFIIRVGGQKVLMYQSTTYSNNNSSVKQWVQNNPSDGSDNDLVGLGFGVNVDNRLRVDFVASDDIPYTLGNILGGTEQYLFSRISATYSF